MGGGGLKVAKKQVKKNHDESYEECNGLEKEGSGFSSSDQERFSRDGDI